MGKFKFPSAYTILFFLIAVVAVLTWIVPAGQYHMAMNEALGKEVPVAGTYAHVAAHPQGLVSVLMAPIAGCTIRNPARPEPSTWRCLF